MSQDSSLHFLLEISQELARFQFDLLGKFRCPVCFEDHIIASREISEEHVIPISQGGKVTTFLCKPCNSTFGSKQTRWLSDWIDLNEGGAPFHIDPKKQGAKCTANGRTVNGSLKVADDGVLEFWDDRNRSNPKDYDAHWKGPKPSEIKITYNVPLLRNEASLEVGFLTAAYGLWFKNFGYSFVLQSNLDIVRKQILNPDDRVMDWNFVIEVSAREIIAPSIGIMRFDEDYFPIAVIYDHIVLLPSAKKLHPKSTDSALIFKKELKIEEVIAPRYQHRCVGPAILICDGQEIIRPDLIAKTTIPPQYVKVDIWK